MLEHEIGLAREVAIRPLVARRGTEQMTVQPRDELAERGAPRGVEPRFGQVLGGGLRRMELEGLVAIEVQQHGDEAVRERLGIPPLTGEALGALTMCARVLEPETHRPRDPPRRPRRGPRDPPHHVAHVREHPQERHDQEHQHCLKHRRMARLGSPKPVEETAQLLDEPVEQGAPRRPAIRGPREHLGDRPAQRVDRDALSQEGQDMGQTIPNR